MAAAGGAAAGFALTGGNPLGAAIGALIGGLADSFFIFPALFGEELVQGGEIGSFDVNFAEEGSGATYCYGSKNRVGAQIVYASLPFSRSQTSGGGKRGEVTQLTWYADVAYVACWNITHGVEDIDFDGEVAYTEQTSFSSNKSVAQVLTQVTEGENVAIVFTQQPSGFYDVTYWEMAWENVKSGGTGGGPVDVPELAQYTVGATVTISLVDTTSPYAGSWDLPANFPANRMAEPAVVESRVTSVSQVNGVENTRLVVDMTPFVDAMESAFLATGNPIVGVNGYSFDYNWYFGVAKGIGSPFTITNAQVPFQPYPETASPAARWVITQTNAKLYPGAATEIEVDPGQFVPPSNFLGQLSVYTRRLPFTGPGQPGTTRIGIEDLNTSMHGNRIPAATVFINEAYTPATSGTERDLQYMLERVCLDHGPLAQIQLNFDKLSPVDVLGLQFQGTQQSTRLIARLQLAFDFHVAEHSSQLHFVSRDNRTELFVPHQHLDARPLDSEPELPLRIRDQGQESMPRRIHVRYTDVDKDLQWGDVMDIRDTTALVTDATRQVNVEIPLARQDARRIARRLMRDTQEHRYRTTIRLPLWAPGIDVLYSQVTETDILVFSASASLDGTTYKNVEWVLAVDRVDIGADFLFEIECFVLPERPSLTALPALSGETTPKQEGAVDRSLFSVPPRRTVILDIPPLLDEHARTTGVYVAYSAPGASEFGHSPAARLLRDLGDGANFEDVGEANRPSLIGQCRRPLLDAPVGVAETLSLLDVELWGSDAVSILATVTDADLDAGDNLAAVSTAGGEWELIQFRDVTDLGTAWDGASTGRLWRMTGLRRGLFGTEHLVDQHQAGDLFVLLDRGRLPWYPIELQLVGTQLGLKVVGYNRSAALDSAGYAILVGRSSISLPVANLASQRNGSDVVLTWDRRSRARVRAFGTVQPPLVEGTERYHVVINPATTARTIDVDGGLTTATYTAAMQADDGTTDAELSVDVYQIDQVRGRGQAATLIVPATSETADDESGDPIQSEGGTTLLTEG